MQQQLVRDDLIFVAQSSTMKLWRPFKLRTSTVRTYAHPSIVRILASLWFGLPLKEIGCDRKISKYGA